MNNTASEGKLAGLKIHGSAAVVVKYLFCYRINLLQRI
jgi:hypothetical protein